MLTRPNIRKTKIYCVATKKNSRRSKSLEQIITMADNKRNSIAGKIATPNLKAGGVTNKDVIDTDSNLYKAVGSR